MIKSFQCSAKIFLPLKIIKFPLYKGIPARKLKIKSIAITCPTVMLIIARLLKVCMKKMMSTTLKSIL
jgi:hypothetical protein